MKPDNKDCAPKPSQVVSVLPSHEILQQRKAVNPAP